MYGDYAEEEVVEMEQDGTNDSTWLGTTTGVWHPSGDN
jgi:hypothetical protein